MTAPPATAHLRETDDPQPDLSPLRLLMLADYLEAHPERYRQQYYINPHFFSLPDHSTLALWNSHIGGCAAGLAVLMFAHEDGEICGGGGVYAHKGRIVLIDRKAQELLGITRQCAMSLFHASAPPAGVIACLRALANGDNIGPVLREYEEAFG